REREWSGGSAQAKIAKPVTDSALVNAWPGNGLPNTIQSRTAHGAKTRPATTAGTAIQTRRSRRDLDPLAVQATTAQVRPIHTASLRVSAASPISPPRIRRRVSDQEAAGRAAIRVISRHAARVKTANGIVESSSVEWRSSG